MNIVVIGGLAAGPKVDSQINRFNPGAHVILIENREFLFYAGCGHLYSLLCLGCG